MANCQYCANPLTRHEQFAGTLCSDWRCQTRHLESQLDAHRAEAAGILEIARPDKFPIAVVPAWSPKLTPLAEASRRKMKDFLDELIQAIGTNHLETETEKTDPDFAEAVTDIADSPETTAHLGRVCAVCRGFCCFYGGTRHAFLDRETLRHFLSGNPEVSPDAIVAEYLTYLPEQHFAGACVYQTDRGCVLPRTMRAAICNDYECKGLKEARRTLYAKDELRVFVVVRHDNRIQRSAFIEGSVIRHYEPDAERV